MKYLKATLLGSGALASLLLSSVLTSCQDEDFGYTAEQIAYESNFTKKFGEIPSDMTWDFTTYARRQNISSDSEPTPETRAELGSLVSKPYNESKKWYKVPSQTLDWMKATLTEQYDNRYLGSPFTFKMPSNPVAIVPIYQGRTGIIWDFEIKVNDYDLTKLWTQSENIRINGTGTDCKLGYTDAGQTVMNPSSGSAVSEMNPCYTDEATSVYTRPIIISNVAGKYAYFSLHNLYKKRNKKTDGTYGNNYWDSSNEWTTKGNRLTSLDGHMLALDLPGYAAPKLDELPEIDNHTPASSMIIACEDADGTKSDHDVNDLVFLVVGYPNLPEVVSTTEVVKKRYMCEDLGLTDDFDFNDIVVDVTETKQYEINTSGTISGDNSQTFPENITGKTYISGSQKQYATLKHVCGTLPFQVKIGNSTLFDLVKDPTDQQGTINNLTYTRGEVIGDGWNPNIVREIKNNDWDPNTNNITIVVQGWGDGNEHTSLNYSSASTGDYPTFVDYANGKIPAKVNFPNPGEVPFIIAVDQDVMWMKERQDIPQSWITNKSTVTPTDAEDYDHIVTDTGSSYLYEKSLFDNRSNADVTYTPDAIIWSGYETLKDYGEAIRMNKDFSQNTYGNLTHALNDGYNVINIYTKKENRTFALRQNGEGWPKHVNTDPGNFTIGNNVAGTDNDYYVISIPLTSEQISSISNSTNGTLIQYFSNRYAGETLTIRKITMSKLPSDQICTVTVSSNGDANVTATDSNGNKWNTFQKINVIKGTSFTFTANAGDDYKNPKFSNNSQASYQTTISSNTALNVTVEDKYLAKVKVTVQPQASWGSVTITSGGRSGTDVLMVPENEEISVTMEAIPASDYMFVKWSDNTVNTTRTVSNLTVQANATKDYYVTMGKNLWYWADGYGMQNIDSKFQTFNNNSQYKDATAISNLNNALNEGQRTLVIYFKKSIYYTDNGERNHFNYHIYAVYNNNPIKLDANPNRGNRSITYYEDRIIFELTNDDANIIKNKGGFYVSQEYENNVNIIGTAIY